MTDDDELFIKKKLYQGYREKERILRGAARNLFISKEAKDDANQKADQAAAEAERLAQKIKDLESKNR